MGEAPSYTVKTEIYLMTIGPKSSSVELSDISLLKENDFSQYSAG